MTTFAIGTLKQALHKQNRLGWYGTIKSYVTKLSKLPLTLRYTCIKCTLRLFPIHESSRLHLEGYDMFDKLLAGEFT